MAIPGGTAVRNYFRKHDPEEVRRFLLEDIIPSLWLILSVDRILLVACFLSSGLGMLLPAGPLQMFLLQ